MRLCSIWRRQTDIVPFKRGPKRYTKRMSDGATPGHSRHSPGVDNGDPRQYKFVMGSGKARANAPIYASLTFLAIALMVTPASIAQVVSATLTGTVSDSSGAVVPGAVVTATEVNTGVSRSTQTSAEGVYALPFLN